MRKKILIGIVLALCFVGFWIYQSRQDYIDGDLYIHDSTFDFLFPSRPSSDQGTEPDYPY